VARGQQVRHVLMAVPSAEKDFVQRVADLCTKGDLTLLVLPTVAEVFGAPVVRDIRPVTPADLLGRAEATIDPEAVRAYVRGRRVLVTGAGGSIGSELCRQLAKYEPAVLVMLDRDESALQHVQLSLDGRGLLDTPNLVLADIRDKARLVDVFSHHRPEVVFHAAALKHLPLLEGAPEEAWKTNVVGTQHVLDAALASGVEYFVNISTDKAANPISVLGLSKRLTERLTSAASQSTSSTYVSVRFGNVLGSRGSVLTTFRTQAAAGGPITVTHPEVTRFFMSIEEAVRLTKYAAAIGTSGEAMVLDMGTPVRIADVAGRFANQQDPPLSIVFTGLRPGEKVHEDLFNDDECGDRRVHPLISHVDVPPLAFEHLMDFVADRGVITAALLAEAVRCSSLKVPEVR
jgi:FlaA1/EpsC-like NDP-sugar epimerase